MESSEGIVLAGVTVIPGEAPSSYHVNPRFDNLSQVTKLSQAPLPLGSVLDGNSEKKKRGRPRKYGSVAHTLSPMPISVSTQPASTVLSIENQAVSPAIGVSGGIVTPPVTSLSLAEKPRKGRPIGSQNKPRSIVVSENIGELISCSSGGSFTPHTITVNAGEDVTEKIIALSQQGPRAVCVVSANGIVSEVTLGQSSSGGTYTYEGNFDILSLTGSFTPTTISGGASSGRIGNMSVTLAQPDGNVFGGLLAGLLIAASPVQVVVASFLPINQTEKPKKHKYELKVARAATGSVARLPPNMGKNHSSPVVPIYSDNLKSTVPPPYQKANWPTMPMMQESRKFTDINISLQEE